ncbi:MAG: hypothetical protein ABH879_07635 [archaeon]
MKTNNQEKLGSFRKRRQEAMERRRREPLLEELFEGPNPRMIKKALAVIIVGIFILAVVTSALVISTFIEPVVNATRIMPVQKGEVFDPFASVMGFCRGIVDPLMSDKCIFLVAMNSGDEGLCAGIKSATARSSCQSVFGRNKYSCNAIDPLQRNDCFHSLAIMAGDPALCDKLIRATPLQISGIPLLDSPTAARCKLDVAAKTSDAGICEDLANVSQQECLRGMAGMVIDEDFCDGQEDEDSCLEHVHLKQVVSLGNPAGCAMLGESNAEQCYTELALERRDYRLCHDAPDPQECLASIMPYVLDQDMCNTLSKDEKAECLYRLAVYSKSPESCRHLLEPEMCLHEMAYVFQDPMVCSLLADSEDCHLSIAKHAQDPEKCGGITDLKKRLDCRSTVKLFGVPDVCTMPPGIVCEDWKLADQQLSMTLRADVAMSGLSIEADAPCHPDSIRLKPGDSITVRCDANITGQVYMQELKLSYADAKGTRNLPGQIITTQ